MKIGPGMAEIFMDLGWNHFLQMGERKGLVGGWVQSENSAQEGRGAEKVFISWNAFANTYNFH